MSSFTLFVERPDREPQTLRSDATVLLIGREAGDLVLGDHQISGRHGQIEFDGHAVAYRDLGSTNGSFLGDGSRIHTPVPLPVGGVVLLGRCRITVQAIESEAAAAPPPPAEPEGKRTMIATPGMMLPPRPPGAPVMPPPPGGARGPMPSPPAPVGWAAGPRPGAAPVPSAGLPPPGGVRAATPPPFDPPGAVPAAPAPAGLPPPPQGGAMPGLPPPPSGGAAPPLLPPPAGGAAPGPEGEAMAAFTAAGGGIWDAFKESWAIFRPHLVPGALVVGVLTVPLAVVQGIASLVPLLGLVIAVVVGLIQLAFMPLATVAVGRWSLALVAHGRAPTLAAVWKATLASAKSDWVNMLVCGLLTFVGLIFLIVPGILLSMFIMPIYLIERLEFVQISLRSLQLAAKDLVRILTFVLILFGLCIAVAIPMGIVGFAMTFVPLVGGLVSSLLGAVVGAVAYPFMFVVVTRLYLDLRRRVEGVDVLEAARVQSAPLFGA